MPDKRCLSLRQRMTVFGFFGGGLLSIRAGAWIRAPTRRCVSERWRSQFQSSRRETANSQFSLFNSQFSRRTAAWGQAALRLQFPVSYCLVGTPPHLPRCARHLPPKGGRLCRSPVSYCLMPAAYCLIPLLPVAYCLIDKSQFHPRAERLQEKFENYEKLCFTFDKPCATIYRLAECHSPGAQFADHTDRILSPWAEIIERW